MAIVKCHDCGTTFIAERSSRRYCADCILARDKKRWQTHRDSRRAVERKTKEARNRARERLKRNDRVAYERLIAREKNDQGRRTA